MLENRSNKLWWILHDWVTYKVPVDEGRVLLPEEYFGPGFELNSTEHSFRFIKDKRDQRKIADFSQWAGGALFINESAFEVFEDMFLHHGRIFPIRCDEKPYFIVFIDKKHAAVDIQKSIFKILRDDGRPLEDNIAKIKRIVLRKDFETGDDIFRTNNGSEFNWKLNLQIIVSDRFKTRYERSNLTGIIFRAADGDD